MGQYGRNFETVVSPRPQDRNGRYVNASGADIPKGAPVVWDDADPNALGLLGVDLATGAQAPPDNGGVVLSERIDGRGVDPVLNGASDFDTVEDGEACQVIRGSYVKVLLKNTEEQNFLQSRTYAARTMVAGLTGATPTIAAGDLLTPGDGNDTDGYWAETANANEGWLYVERVDTTRGWCVARLLF